MTQHSKAAASVPVVEASTCVVEPGGETDHTTHQVDRNADLRICQQLSTARSPQLSGFDICRRPLGYKLLPRHETILLAAIYDACISSLELSVSEYNDFITSPWVHESIAGSERTTLLLVSGAHGSMLESPGSLPVVVCWIGDQLGDDGPEQVDVVVGQADVDELAQTVGRNPLAATTLAVLLRSSAGTSVAAGLAQESAAYSMLQASPEFAAWRAATESTAVVSHKPSTLTVERHDSTLVVTLDRPQRHNAITSRMRDELCEALAIAETDDSISHVVLRGRGPSFCSGGDLSEFGSRTDPATAHITRLAISPARMLHGLCDRLTAEIHGATLGGGIEMAAFASRVVASGDTTIGLPEVGLGLIPGAGGTVSLPRRIGRQRTAALALTDRRINAQTALAWGLVDEIAN